jgi:HPt (histidine-containing phosphotransfer) domain-containing protein
VGDAIGSGVDATAPSGYPAGLLNELSAILAPSALRALLETGRAEIATNHRSLLAAVGANRPDDARRFAHRLASSAGVLGLEGLVAAARATEARAADENREALGSLVDEVSVAVEAAHAELDRWLAPAMTQTAGS